MCIIEKIKLICHLCDMLIVLCNKQITGIETYIYFCSEFMDQSRSFTKMMLTRTCYALVLSFSD